MDGSCGTGLGMRSSRSMGVERGRYSDLGTQSSIPSPGVVGHLHAGRKIIDRVRPPRRWGRSGSAGGRASTG